MRLYHGTGARNPEGEKLRAEDGLIHTHTDQDAVANYAKRVWADESYVIDCEADGELDDAPQVPDLDDWDPDALAKELVRAGTISQQESVPSHTPLPRRCTDAARHEAREGPRRHGPGTYRHQEASQPPTKDGLSTPTKQGNHPTMTAKKPTFTTENIVAILKAAPEGGSYEAVLRRANVSISISSLMTWIMEGNQDLSQNKTTAYGLFDQRWNAVYPGPPPRHEEVRLTAMRQALEELGEEPVPEHPAPV